MLAIQKSYLGCLDELQNILDNAECASDLDVTDFQQQIEYTELLIPVVGAFSSGKSSLLNNFLGEDHLLVDMTPETALATELRYGQPARIVAIKADSEEQVFGLDAMAEVSRRAEEFEYLKLYLQNPGLQAIQPLVLVDMPGFDSPLDIHNKAITNYLDRGAFYVVLVSAAEDAILTQSLLRQLETIRNLGRGFAVFLSKCNLRPDNDILRQREHLQEELEDYFDYSEAVLPLALNGGKNLQQVVQRIDPETLLGRILQPAFKACFYKLIETFNVSISSYKRSADENRVLVESLYRPIKELKQQRETLLREAEEKYGEQKADSILLAMQAELEAAMEELVTAALSGQDGFLHKASEITRYVLIREIQQLCADTQVAIAEDIGQSLRHVSSEGLAMPLLEISNRVHGMVADSAIRLLNSFDNRQANSGKNAVGMGGKLIGVVLKATPLRLIVNLLADVLGGALKQKIRERQKVQLRQQIRYDLIPSISQQLDAPLRRILRNQATQTATQLAQNFEQQLTTLQQQVQAAEQDKTADLEVMQQKTIACEQALARIKQLMNRLIEK